jgi:serine/threonine protein kinase/Tfp pilus assembly protein PilF
MIGQTISHYKILEEIGAGGMGVVYKAEDTKLKRTVALKFLPPQLTSDREAKKRFLHEARAASALDHPNICNIFEIDETDDGQLFIAMGYYEGQTLKEKISGVGENGGSPLPIHEAINITIQIAEGLNKAHQKDIVHRDIKSANIMITDEGVVKILDFGLAKLRGTTKLTKEGTTLGTVAYMSPEQASGDKVDHRSDIWSLGVILYEMITGQLPFKGDYEQAVMYAIMNEEPESVTSLRTGIPLELENIINKALSKNISERYQHIEDLLVDLKRVSKSLSKSKPEIKTINQKKKRKPFIPSVIIGFVLILSIVIAGYFIFIKKPAPKRPDIQKKPAVEKTLETKWKNSIAVLPFADLSSQKDQEYFCDGMTDDLITRLTRIRELKVIARTSVLRYKNSQKDIKEIGKELGVDTILEGSIQKEKDRIRINAQLINVADSSHLWADRFDERLESVFDLQDRVTASIAEALKMKFTQPSADTIKNSQPNNVEAFEYYLQGMHYIKTKYTVTLDEKDFQTSLKMFKKAIQTDKNYALAYFGLAWAHYHYLVNTGDNKGWQLWKENINMAYQLDPDSALINAGMGLTAIFNDEHDRGCNFFKNALKINSNISEVHQTIGFVFLNRILYEKSLPYLRRAIELDPFYIWSRAHLANALSYLGEFEKAEIYFQQNLELDPNDLRHFCYYAVQFMKKKQFAKAAELIEKAENIKLLHTGAPYSNISYYKGLLFASRGEKEKTFTIYKKPSAYMYSLLGMKDEAIKRLNENIKESKKPKYLDLINNPFYDNLRDDPRFQKIVKKEKQKFEELVKKYQDL